MILEKKLTKTPKTLIIQKIQQKIQQEQQQQHQEQQIQPPQHQDQQQQQDHHIQTQHEEQQVPEFTQPDFRFINLLADDTPTMPTFDSSPPPIPFFPAVSESTNSNSHFLLKTPDTLIKTISKYAFDLVLSSF